ncbi:MAG: MarR family transcriptional regulator [Anaerolineae bacterium]|nr:MarR family transcriptional regulator [Anaerolineae bacterium]
MPDLSDDFLLLNNQFCFTLYAASRKVIQSYAPLLNELDLTYTQYITLLVLWEHPVLPVKDLGDFLMLDTGTLSPLLKKLENKGLVTRTRSRSDERIVMIKITEAGAALKSTVLNRLPDLLCKASPDAEEIIDLRNRLQRVILHMEACQE